MSIIVDEVFCCCCFFMVWPSCSGSLELLLCGPFAEGKFPKIGITAEMVNEFFQNLFFVGVC